MHARSFVLALGSVALAGSALAQGAAINPACLDSAFVGSGQQGGIACQRAFDSFAYASQQYAILLSAGNIEPGRADALGGLGKYRLGLHITGMSLSAPDLKSDNIPAGPAGPGPVATQLTDYAMVAVDGTFGLYKGLDMGFGRVGAVDAWVSLNIVPGSSASGYSVTPSNKFYLGFAGRLALLQEGKVLPGVGLSYLVRNLPTSTLTASDYFNNTIWVYNMKVNAKAWSGTVGKHFGTVGLLLGAGQTDFTSSGNVTWAANGQNPGTQPAVSGASTQMQFFGDFSLTLDAWDFVFEVGQVSGSQLKTYNTFEPEAGSSRSYASFTLAFAH